MFPFVITLGVLVGLEKPVALLKRPSVRALVEARSDVNYCRKWAESMLPDIWAEPAPKAGGKKKP